MIIGLPGLAYITIHIPKVQAEAIERTIKYLEKTFETRISFTRVDVKLFNRVVLNNLYIEDQAGDTLLYADRFTGNLRHFNNRDRELYINRIILDQPDIRFRIDSSGVFNLNFITSQFKRKDTTKAKLKIRFNEIVLQDGKFSFQSARGGRDKPGINFSDLALSHLNLDMNRLHIKNDTVSFSIENLDFIEKSGLEVRHWKSENTIHSHFAEIRSLNFQTSGSSLRMSDLRFDYPSYKSLGSFTDSVQMKLDIETSNLSLADLALFVPALSGMEDKVLLKGRIDGLVSDLKGREISMFYGGNTIFNGDFDLIGLPDMEETFIFFDVEDLVTTVADLEALELPGFRKIVIPENFRKLGIISYQGNFTGFTNDFVAYGKMSTSLGNIDLDLSIKPGQGNQFSYEGSLKTSSFQVGELTGTTERVGRISLSANLAGVSLGNKQFTAELDGLIDSVYLNGYQYTNIDLNGKLTDRMFDGTVDIEDPNVKLNFLGLLDFSREVPEFDFTLNIPRASLYNLNIDKQDTASALSLLMTANFVGNSLDNLDGDIKMFNSSLHRLGRDWKIFDFSLSAANRPDTSLIKLRSDFLDAEIRGKYEFAYLPDAFRHILKQYIPAFQAAETPAELLATNDFSYSLKFKNMDPVFQVFMPEYSISRGSTLQGRFSPLGPDFSFTARVEKLSFGKNHFSNLEVQSLSGEETYTARVRADHLYLGRNFDLTRIVFSSRLQDDSLALDLRWDDQAEIRNMGEFHSFASFMPSPGGRFPAVRIQVMPSQFIVQDTLWTLFPSQIHLDSSYVKVDGFRLQNRDQVLDIQGVVSQNPGDTLNLGFSDLDLNLANLFLNNEKTTLGGVINGKASFSKLYNNPMFSSQLEVRDLSVNGEDIGNTSITSQWDPDKRAILAEANALRNDTRTIRMKGEYLPEEQSLDFDIDLDKLRVTILQSFLSAVFKEVNGMASGDLSLTGSLKAPLFNGEISLQKASMLLNFLNTRYTFTHNISIRDNSLFFDNVTINDMNGKTARLNGSIQNNFFRDFVLDLTVDARDFHFLNTTYEDNSDFYGTAFGTGVIRIAGPPSDLEINITARTEKNTSIFIPLDAGEEIEEVPYVRFINTLSDAAREVDKQEYQVNLSGIRMNFNLEITPDAEAQLIFDSQMGDIIRGRGSGNINMEINTFGKFRMFGEYEFSEGDYLFTLQNIINKRLEIREGSKIVWNGDPLDANIDLEAVYSLRTSLYELFMEEEYRRRIPVECQLFLTNKLMNPNIRFDIALPTADEETRNYLRNAVNTEEKLSKQFLSLLVLNSFLPDPNISPASAPNPLGNYALGAESVGVTTSELLSNQLSRWLSQISNDLDIGFTYRPGDEINRDQVEVALSTQLLNDRVLINSNVDVGGYQSPANTSNIVGDFNVEVKLNESGKLRVKAFNRANDKLIYELAPYTQGIGLFYREEFNTFGQLMKKYWNSLFGKKEEEPAPDQEEVPAG